MDDPTVCCNLLTTRSAVDCYLDCIVTRMCHDMPGVLVRISFPRVLLLALLCPDSRCFFLSCR